MLYYTCRKVEREILKPFGFAYRREGRIDPYVHNNPPKILHPLSLIFPLLKLIIVPCRSVCNSFFVWFTHICYSLKNSRSKDRLFFVIHKQTDAQPFLLTLQGRPSNPFVAAWRINPRIISPRVSYYLYSATLGFDALECYYVL